MPVHIVQSGEYLSLITLRYGLPWEKVWEDPGNAGLRELRKSPNILYPGDEVYLPDATRREESGAGEQRHRFRRKGGGQQLRLILRDDFGKPLADLEYRLHVTGQAERVGTTTGDGMVAETLPADVDLVSLVVPALELHLSLMVGHLDPVSRLTGVQQRLNNLGFNCGPVDGIIGPLTRSALRRFQTWAGLPVTGRADSETREALEEAHDGLRRGTVPEDDGGTAPEPVDAGEAYGPSDTPEAGTYGADGAGSGDED